MTDTLANRLKAELAGYEKILSASVPGARGDPAHYTGGADAAGREGDAGHLLYMIARALAPGNAMSLPKTASLVRHGMRALGLLADKAADPGTSRVRVHVSLTARLNRVLCVLVRDVTMPTGVVPHHLKFPDIDPEGRLPVLEDLGIMVNWAVFTTEYDFGEGVLGLHLRPVVIDPRLSEESVALAISMYRAAGWDYRGPDDRRWPALFAEDKAAYKASFNGPSPSEQLLNNLHMFGHVIPVPGTSPTQERRKRRKRRDNQGGPHGGEGGEGGEADAGGDQG